jgi:hypothetical protein
LGKTRALGIDTQFLLGFEAAYGTPPDGSGGGVYYRLPFREFTLGAEKPLGYDPLLGQGRDAQDPHYEAVTDEGEVQVPIDLRSFGVWLKAQFGAPVSTAVKATGTIAFAANPAPGDTIALNGTVWTFVAGAPGAAETQIQASLADSLVQLAADLNGSADPEVSRCTYAATATALEIEHDAAGPAGNAFTVAASAATVSAASLGGGHYRHVYKSGGEVPSAAGELGHTKLSTPRYERHAGIKCMTLAFEMARSGPANATIGLIAQGESVGSTAADATPITLELKRFNRSKGKITVGGAPLANVTGGRFTFSNNVEPVETIRDDDLIDGADEGEATAEGTVDVRFGADATLSMPIDAETPVAMTYAFGMPGVEGHAVVFDLPRVFLPRKKKEVRGPGGIQASYDWRASGSAPAPHCLQVTLTNDVVSY